MQRTRGKRRMERAGLRRSKRKKVDERGEKKKREVFEGDTKEERKVKNEEGTGWKQKEDQGGREGRGSPTGGLLRISE